MTSRDRCRAIGTNPTFGDEPVHLEAYLLDFDREVLGQSISVEFWHRLRGPLREILEKRRPA